MNYPKGELKDEQRYSRKIISISGKPGLYKLISQTRNMVIAESILDKEFPQIWFNKLIFCQDKSMV